MDENTTSTEPVEQTATATEETTPAAAPVATDDGSFTAGSIDDAYTQELRKRFGKKDEASAPEQTPESVEKAETAAEPKDGAPEAKPAKKAPATRDSNHKKWWKEKTPEEKASITAKQTREELKAARDEIKALKAQIEELKPKPGKKGELTRADFDSEREWQRHLVDERLLELSEEKAAAEKEEAEVAARDKARNAKWAQAMETAFTDPEERQAAAELFHTEVNKMGLAQSVYDYILESGQPRVLLHIVRHPGAQELLKAGTPELLVGRRLMQIEKYLEGQQTSKLVGQTAKPAAKTAPREPALKSATGSANNIGSASVATKSREADQRTLQARILGLRE